MRTEIKKMTHGTCQNQKHGSYGKHERKADCLKWEPWVVLVGCDAPRKDGHGAKSHRQTEACINPSPEKSDPFYGF